jgi:tetratricopeptide (TPR) repeat protein
MGRIDSALAALDGAFALSERTGQRWHDAELNRLRGEILLQRDPANAAPAEEAFLTAVAIAQQQKARSFELRAALSLARLYQSSGRPVDAHAVLAPALDGFSPTPEFPEIEEAQTLLAALADSEEVKNAATGRQRRLRLQTSLGQALIWAKGFGARETDVAFVRAQELATGLNSPAERFTSHNGLWVGNLVRGEFKSARERAEIFRHEAENGPWFTEAVVARRNLGATCFFQGELTNARAHLERAIGSYDAERDREAKFRFGHDPGAGAATYLALTTWLLGELERARELIDDALARAVQSAHA